MKHIIGLQTKAELLVGSCWVTITEWSAMNDDELDEILLESKKSIKDHRELYPDYEVRRLLITSTVIDET